MAHSVADLAVWGNLSAAQKEKVWRRAKRAERRGLRAEADKFAEASVAPATAAAYKKAWAGWEKFAKNRRLRVLPSMADDIEAYLVAEFASVQWLSFRGSPQQ